VFSITVFTVLFYYNICVFSFILIIKRIQSYVLLIKQLRSLTAIHRYIVYDVAQVNIKYLLKMNFKHIY